MNSIRIINMITASGRYMFSHRKGTIEMYNQSGEHKADIYKDDIGWVVDSLGLGFTKDEFKSLEEALDYLHVIVSLPKTEEL